MYKIGKIKFDTRKYDVDEVFRRYKSGILVFYKKNGISEKRRSKETGKVLEALLRGIPFPPVYTSELQTGELLVLDKSDRLRFLMEYLEFASGDDEELIKDIFYAPIILYVIDYMNPKYMHMQVGAFIGEWSVTQEQSIRNVLYEKVGAQVLSKLLADIRYSPKSELTVQYQFLYFMMVYLVMAGLFDQVDLQNADKFQLLEETMYLVQKIDDAKLRNVCESFKKLYDLVKEISFGNKFFLQALPQLKTKYLCFMGAWQYIRGGHSEKMYENKEIRTMITDCDMGYQDISRILESFRKDMYDIQDTHNRI